MTIQIKNTIQSSTVAAADYEGRRITDPKRVTIYSVKLNDLNLLCFHRAG